MNSKKSSGRTPVDIINDVTVQGTLDNLSQVAGVVPPVNTTSGFLMHPYAAGPSQTEAVTPVIIGNQSNNNTGIFSYLYTFNGTTWDRTSNNLQATVFASAVRTATANSADQNNVSARGALLTLDITAASGTTPTLDITIEAKDPVSSFYIAILSAAFAQKTTTGQDSLLLYPGITSTANRQILTVLSRIWRVVATIGGTTPSFTFSLGCSYVL